MSTAALIFYGIACFACSFAAASVVESLLLFFVGTVRKDEAKGLLESGPGAQSIPGPTTGRVLQFPPKLSKRNLVEGRPEPVVGGEFAATGAGTDLQATTNVV